MAEDNQKVEPSSAATLFPEGASLARGRGNFRRLPRCWDVGGRIEEVAA